MSDLRPARGYSWADAEPGNFLAGRHLANSPRVLDAMADGIEEQILADAPWLDAPVYRGAVRSLARVEAELELRWRWVDEHGLVDDDGEERPGAERRERAEARAAKLRESMGLTPMSSLRMLALASNVDGETAKATIDELAKRGRAIREAAEQRAIGAGQ